MKVVYLDTIDWEPLRLQFEFASQASIETNLIQEVIDNSFRAATSCACKLLQKKGQWKSESIYLYEVEWACRRCIELKLERIGSEIGDLKCVKVGLDAGPLAADFNVDLIDVPEKMIIFENGRKAHVPAFRIQRTPITVGQFMKFAETTGYQSVGEAVKADETYRSNQTLSGASGNERKNRYACFLAAEDAFAFCKYHNVRLPTEAEWISAAVYDWNEYDLSDPQTAIAIASRKRPENALRVVAFDFTSTVEGGRIVARKGPAAFLEKKWRIRRNRALFGPKEFDLDTGFRIALL